MNEYKLIKFKDRRGSNSEKWDNLKSTFGRDDLIAAWVADMDIESPDCVKKALQEYIDYNVFAYYCVPDSYNAAIIDWHRDHHNYLIEPEWIRFIPGVVQGIYWLVSTLTEPGEAVAIMSPVYYPFRNSIVETGRSLVDVPLVEQDGKYTMDCEVFEQAIVDSNVKLFILCSPHNPVGRVWTRDELKAVLDICMKHNVYVIADEIHNDIIISGNQHTVAATAGDEGEYDSIMVTLMSASKTFNLAAMNQAYAIIPDVKIRAAFDEYAKQLHISEGTPLGYIAYEAAYKNGEPWLAEMLDLIENNYYLLRDSLKETLPQAVISPLEGTYLCWINLNAYNSEDSQYSSFADKVVNLCRIAPDYGEWFGGEAYEGFIRINLATSRNNIKEIADRLALVR